MGTSNDAARFLQMHVANGSLSGEQILRPEVATEMRRITMKGKRYELGLGWFKPARQRNSIPDFVEHLGGGAGFFNCMRVYPAEGVGAIVIGNATKYDVDSVASLALEALRKLEWRRRVVSFEIAFPRAISDQPRGGDCLSTSAPRPPIRVRWRFVLPFG